MRIFLLALALLLPAGCGAADERSGAGARTDTASPPVESSPSLPSDEDVTKPPPIVLTSAAGRQKAVPGSSCVDFFDAESGRGVGACADTEEPAPDELSIVRPGEKITIALEDAAVVRSEGCVGEDEQDCIGRVTIQRLGCPKARAGEIPLALGNETRWQVDLRPGRYELDVFAYFDAPDGRSGDVSGSLGIVVDDAGPQEIVPAPDELGEC